MPDWATDRELDGLRATAIILVLLRQPRLSFVPAWQNDFLTAWAPNLWGRIRNGVSIQWSRPLARVTRT